MKRIISLILAMTLLFSVNSMVLATNDEEIFSSNYSVGKDSTKNILAVEPKEPVHFSTKKTNQVKGIIQWFGYAFAAKEALEGDFKEAITIAGISTLFGYISNLSDM